MQQAADDLKAAEQLKALKLKLEQEQPGALPEASVKAGGLTEIEAPIVQKSKFCLIFWTELNPETLNTLINEIT